MHIVNYRARGRGKRFSPCFYRLEKAGGDLRKYEVDLHRDESLRSKAGDGEDEPT